MYVCVCVMQVFIKNADACSSSPRLIKTIGSVSVCVCVGVCVGVCINRIHCLYMMYIHVCVFEFLHHSRGGGGKGSLNLSKIR